MSENNTTRIITLADLWHILIQRLIIIILAGAIALVPKRKQSKDLIG